jgi:hypothetical protein
MSEQWRPPGTYEQSIVGNDCSSNWVRTTLWHETQVQLPLLCLDWCMPAQLVVSCTALSWSFYKLQRDWCPTVDVRWHLHWFLLRITALLLLWSLRLPLFSVQSSIRWSTAPIRFEAYFYLMSWTKLQGFAQVGRWRYHIVSTGMMISVQVEWVWRRLWYVSLDVTIKKADAKRCGSSENAAM